MCGQWHARMRHTKREDPHSNRQSSMVTAFKSTAAEEETISTEDESWSDTSKLEMMALHVPFLFYFANAETLRVA